MADRAKKQQRRARRKGHAEDVVFAGGDVDIAAAGEGSAPSVQIKAYTGGKLSLPNFSYPVVIDTAGVKAMDSEQLPLLRDHSQDRVVGHGKPEVLASHLAMQGSLSIPGEERDKITAAQNNGFRWQASVGGRIPNRRRHVKTYASGQRVVVNGQTHEGPLHVVTAFHWKETSFVALGADEGRASAAVAASSLHREPPMNEFEKWLEASGVDTDGLSVSQIDSLRAAYDAQAVVAGLDAKGGDDDPNPGLNVDDIVAKAAAAAAKGVSEQIAASRRIDNIAAQYTGAGIDEKEFKDLRDKVEAGEISEEKYQLSLIQASRGADLSNTPQSVDHTSFLVLEAATMRNNGFSEDDIAANLRTLVSEEEADQVMQAANGSRYDGCGIHDIIGACCHAAGHHWYGKIGDEEIRCALEHSERMLGDRSQRLEAASGFSTTSLPGILSRIANKAMLAAYAEADNGGVALIISSVTSTSDFKKFSRYRMTEAGVMEVVPATGEIKHGRVMEEEYENQVETYGKLLTISRQMMRNDDLDAFLQIPRMIGRQGRHALEQVTITTLVDAPTNAAAGTTEFFHGAKRGNQEPNYFEGANSALDMDSYQTAYELFLNQVDADGKPIMIDPAVVLCCNSDIVMARKLYTDTEYRFTGSDIKETINNQWQNMFRPVKSAYLHRLGATPSSTQWYLLSNPTTDVSAIQVAFLDGNRTPVLDRGETQMNTLGVCWRGYYDFGVALQDPRAIVKSKGAA